MPRGVHIALWAAAAVAVARGQTVGVFMEFDLAPGTRSLEVMKKEVGELLKPAGVSLDWRLTRENRGSETFAGLVVLKFKGNCRVDRFTEPGEFTVSSGTRTLGVTKVSDGQVLPYTEVECKPIREALSYLSPVAGAQERQKALGLALGRVVAHEMYHILAHTMEHASEGLAKAMQSLRDLVSPASLGFTEEDWRAMCEGQALSTCPPAVR